MLWPIMKKIVRPAVFQDEFLKMPPGHSHEHSKKLHQIALARAIRADEDVQWPQFKILQFPDGLETADVEFFDCSLHNHTRKTFITSSPRWLITLTAMRPPFGFSKGREVSLCRLSQASASISALSVVFNDL